jgi:hypothetical protein
LVFAVLGDNKRTKHLFACAFAVIFTRFINLLNVRERDTSTHAHTHTHTHAHPHAHTLTLTRTNTYTHIHTACFTLSRSLSSSLLRVIRVNMSGIGQELSRIIWPQKRKRSLRLCLATVFTTSGVSMFAVCFKQWTFLSVVCPVVEERTEEIVHSPFCSPWSTPLQTGLFFKLDTGCTMISTVKFELAWTCKGKQLKKNIINLCW